MLTFRLTRVSRLTTAVLWAAGALVVAPLSFGQFETAAVLGTVSDSRGSALPQARVILEAIQTGTTQTTTTDASGDYQFLEVRVGEYRVTAEAGGFKKTATQAFRVEVGARSRVNTTLEVGDIKEVVQVTETASIVEADSSDR